MIFRTMLVSLAGVSLAAFPLGAQTKSAAEQAAPATGSTVVAKVDGKEITRAQLDEAFQQFASTMAQQGQGFPTDRSKEIELQVLNQMIGWQLLQEKCKAVKVENLDAKVKEQIDGMHKQIPDEKAFADQLKRANLTEAKLKEQIADRLRTEALLDQEVRSKIKIEPDEIQKFYDSHPEYFSQPAQVRASHILVMVPEGADDKVKAEKKAAIDKARDRVTKGEDFAKVAGEVSECPSKSKGGDLGFFGSGQMVKPFEEAAFALKSNEVSQVVTTQFGYHVIKKTDSRSGSTASLEQEKPKIEKFLAQKKTQEGMLAYIETLKKDAKVEILLK